MDGAIYNILLGKFPLSIGSGKPLKIGIFEDLTSMFNDEGRAIKDILRFHTSTKEYLTAIARGGDRYALDGTPTGKITEAEKAIAEIQFLQRIGHKVKPTGPAAFGVERRSKILKAFETSGLPREEFSQLHGFSPTVMNSILKFATKERNIRRHNRMILAKRCRESGLSTEEFALKESMSLKKLNSILGKVERYKATGTNR